MSIDWNSLIQNPVFFESSVIVLGGVLVFASIAVVQWRIAQQAKCDAYLKERLIERGFEAHEIIKVVNARVRKQRAPGVEEQPTCCEPVLT